MKFNVNGQVAKKEPEVKFDLITDPLGNVNLKMTRTDVTPNVESVVAVIRANQGDLQLIGINKAFSEAGFQLDSTNKLKVAG